MPIVNKSTLSFILRAIEVVLLVVVFTLPSFTDLTLLDSFYIALGCFFIVEIISLSSKLTELIKRFDRFDDVQKQRDQLLLLIDRCGFDPDHQGEVFQTMIDIFEKRHPALQDIARWKLNEFIEAIKEIRNGRFVHDRSHQKSFGREGIRYAKKTLDAITFFDSKSVSEFWCKKLAADRYLQANIDAINRGVEVRRIFLYHDALSTEDHVVLTQQYQSGIRVFTFDTNELREAFYEECFIIADANTSNAFASTTIFDGSGHIMYWQQTDEHQKLLDLKQTFQFYLDKSLSYEPPQDPNKNRQWNEENPTIRM